MSDLDPVQAAALFLALNLLLLFLLGYRTIDTRRKTGIGLGHDGNEEMLRAMRIHANFAEYAPLPLLGLFALAALGAPVWLIEVLGGTFTLARYAHAFGFSAPAGKRPLGRFYGILFTGLILLAEAAALLYYIFTG